MGLPEFWFLRNIGGMDQFRYMDLQQRYGEPTSDFLERDAKSLGWDGTNLTSIQNKGYVYRNGDARAHADQHSRLQSEQCFAADDPTQSAAHILTT